MLIKSEIFDPVDFWFLFVSLFIMFYGVCELDI